MEEYRKKIRTLEETGRELDRIRGLGKKTVFTNGCFDILHPGHTRYISQAKGLGDYLVVAVNSDRSVRIIKGAKRPVIPQTERAELVAALESVDSVLIFDQETPLEVIEYLLPDVLVKGGDWAVDKIVGAETVMQAGGRVVSLPYVTGYSTTGLIEDILGRNK